MIDGRLLDNLGADGEALAALQTILNLFGEPYLKAKADSKPLSVLWQRLDRLATVELYIFGTCLRKVQEHNEVWLKQAVREIKSNPTKAKGLFTEIIYLGMFSAPRTPIAPALKNNPGFDFSITSDEGRTQYISIKNIDISEQQAAFQRGCRKLRTKWIEKLKITKSSLGIRVASRQSLSYEDFETIIKAIQNQEIIYTGLHLTPKDGIDVFVVHLPTSRKLSPVHISDSVVVYCPPPNSEIERYTSRVRKASDNLYQKTKHDNSGLRVLFMRMHVNADYSIIEEQARKIVNSPKREADCIVFYQPSYARTQDNSSIIHHCFKIEANAEFARASTQYGLIKCEIPLGSVSTEQSINQIQDLTNGSTFEVRPSDYLYQQGDIYAIGDIGEHISINSPAPGIREHGVCYINGRYVEVTSKLAPTTEELILI